MQDAIILYENGKAIGGEGHQTDADDITFDNTGTDLVSENVEDAIVEVNAKTSGLTRMTKLWENPSPTASFSEQTVALDLSDYDAVIVSAGYDNSSSHRNINCFTSFVGSSGTIDMTNYGASARQRTFDVATTGIRFTATYFNGSSSSIDNTTCIPLAIYGIKII